MIHCIKIVAVYLARYVLRVLWVFPVKRNRVLFVAFEGRVYGCNPKYIFECLQDHLGDTCEYVWCLNAEVEIPEVFHAGCVKYLSPRYLFYLFTSSVVITNLLIEPFFTKRRRQLVITTWHGGGAYKVGDNKSPVVTRQHGRYMRVLRTLRTGQTDYALSSCQAFTDTHYASFGIEPKHFLPTGTPRNDLFFRPGCDAFRKKILRRLDIDTDKTIILYAPTYRGLWHGARLPATLLDVTEVSNAVRERFGRETVFLLRLHPNLKGVGGELMAGAVDVSRYADMQELLLAADVFITDYSSALWDYSFTGRPGFLFVPDLEEYERTTRLYTPIDLWPYPYAKDTGQLRSLIRNYDEEAALKRIRAHHELLGSYENGTATESVCKIIEGHIMTDC